MKIAGVGVVFGHGRGVGALEAALARGWSAPPMRDGPPSERASIPVYAVPQEILADKAVLKNMRRADRFSRMAVLAAWDAVADSGIAISEGTEQLGIILATAFGPQVTAFQFLDETIEHGDAGASPTLFCHSLHNAAASYVAAAFRSRGPTLTLTRFGFAFHQALILARAWMQEGRCSKVLVGSADECGAVMQYVCSQKLKIAEDGKIRPFDFSASPAAVPGEGSVFFLLTAGDAPKTYCNVSGVLFDAQVPKQEPDLYLLDADGMSTDERAYREAASRDVAVASYSPIFGSMLTGSAFHCALAALMLRNQTQYASPVADNPHGVSVCRETQQRKIRRIGCVRYGCLREKAVIELTR